MTDPVDPRPDPVVAIAGQLGGLAQAAFTAVAVLVMTVLTDGITPGNLGLLGNLIGGAVAAVFGLVAFVVAKVHAKKAAEHVTPLSDPVDAQMRPLVVGKHAEPSYDQGGVLPPTTTWVVNNSGAGVQVRRGLEYIHERYGSKEHNPRMTYRLGRLPNQGRPRVKLTAELIPAAVYNPPATVDYYSKVPASSWGMDGNDNYGDCTCAEVDHTTKARQVAAGNTEVKSTAAEVLALYSAVTGFNPNDPSTDQGAEMQAVRDYWRRNGVTLGGKPDKILLFADIEHQDHMLVKWCIDRFGAVALGINFPASAMDQFNAGKPWDVVKGSQIEGGHAITAIGYDDKYLYIVTWGQVQKMTWAFHDAYTEEAWTDLDESFVGSVSGSDPLGETLYALGQQFAAVTGKANPVPAPGPAPVPVPVPPTPTPVPPVPTPTPVPVIPANWVAWAKHTLTLKDQSRATVAVAKEIVAAAQQ
jgi:hypothetical protein